MSQYQYLVVKGLDGGVATTPDATALPPSVAVETNNIDIAQDGAIRSRTGTVRLFETQEGAPITSIIPFGNILVYTYGGTGKYLACTGY